VRELLTLLKKVGHTDFRDARGPMRFTQRQAAGKFTRDETTAVIDRLQNDDNEVEVSVGERPPAMLSAAELVLHRMPAEQLADELRRRGWTVIEP
jgi:hypothetical protein